VNARIRALLQGARRLRYILLAIAALIVVAVGAIGWLQSEPAFTISDAVYWSVALFTLNAPGNPSTVSPALDIARWGAILVAATTLTTLVSAARDTLTEFDVRKRIRGARRLTQHKVIVGDGQEIAGLATSYRSDGSPPSVVAIGDIPPSEAPELRRRGAIVLGGVGDTDLAPILRDASRIIIVGRTDSTTMATASRVERVHGSSPLLTVLVDDRDLAAQWNRTKTSRSVSRPVRVATELLRQYSPMPTAMLVPPPIVIGDSALAGEIARRIVVGWQEPGERLEVHLVGFSPAAFDAATFGLEARGDFRQWDMAPHPDVAPGIVRAIITGHRFANLADNDRITLSGPRVYVAYEDDARTITVAGAIADAIADAEVVGVVADGGAWTSGLVGGTDARLVSSDQMLTRYSIIEKSDAVLMADEIEADAERAGRTAAAGSIPAAGYRAVAERIGDLLSCAGLALDARIWPARTAPLLGPDELNQLADAVAAVLPGGPEIARRDLLAFAARLPTLAARAGHTPDWISDHPVTLAGDDLDALAEAAHRVYHEVARETHNATGSEIAGVPWTQLPPLEVRANYAQVADIPLKLALCGLTWTRRPKPRQKPAGFTATEVEFLAEVEHERWCEFMMRTGRPGSAWNVPWSELTQSARDYDRRLVQAIPVALHRVGIEIVRPAATE
jgi:hypothetical protein